MSIQNKRSAILFPLILALVLIIGMFIGVKLSRSEISERLLIYPKADKVNNVLNLIEDSYVDSVSRDKLDETAIESILRKLDPHSVYISASEFQEMNEPLEGNFSGIGIQFNMQNDTVIIVSVIINGPSDKAGLKAGDRIVKVNDTIVAGVKSTNANIIKKLKGKKGSSVKISVKRIGFATLFNFKITRDKIPLNSIDAAYMITPQTGYIRVNKFARTTYDEFIAAIKRLHEAGMKKVIIDLRGNGGGILETAIKMADQFLDDRQLIVYTEGRSRPRSNSYSTPGGECLHDSVVVILDETSASASEVFAGAIQDNDRGWVVGRRSFGKGLVQEQSLLPGGAAIRLTIARYYTPSGRCIQKPYKGNANYYEEVHNRFLHGEMEKVDSIKFNDSLKFVTHKGRVLYGGGGIMPDFFVPVDTSEFSEYYYHIREKGLIYQYAFYYSDANRTALSKFKNYKDMVKYLKKKNVFDKFVKYADDHGVKKNANDIKISATFLQTDIEAYIARNFFDNAGFYPIINSIDNAVLKAVDLWGDEKITKVHKEK